MPNKLSERQLIETRKRLAQIAKEDKWLPESSFAPEDDSVDPTLAPQDWVNLYKSIPAVVRLGATGVKALIKGAKSIRNASKFSKLGNRVKHPKFGSADDTYEVKQFVNRRGKPVKEVVDLKASDKLRRVRELEEAALSSRMRSKYAKMLHEQKIKEEAEEALDKTIKITKK